jgi:predicted nucleotidyltransferase
MLKILRSFPFFYKSLRKDKFIKNGSFYNNMVKKITKWFYLEPLIYRDWIHLAEISKKLEKNHTVVRKYLEVFEKEGVVVKKIVGKMSMYKLNENYPLLIDVVSIVEKERLINAAKNLILKEIVEFFKNKKIKTVIIFGSFVTDQKKANDVDVLYIGSDINLKEIEGKINKKIHLINIESLDEINSTLKEEIKGKHLIIYNVEEIVKWLI